MIRVTLPDNKILEMPDGATARDVAAKIGPGLARAALGAKADFGQGMTTLDLAAPLTGDCKLALLTDKSPESLTILRHSTAHVMAEALCKLYPETKLVYGPPVDDGFYYDVDLSKKLTPEDFIKIEAEMAAIVQEDRPFTRYEMTREAGLAKLHKEGNPYKVENAERAKGDTLSFYVTGAEPGKYWEDLCMGTHIPSTGRIGAFKVLNVSGAFLHGDATKQQLQRVYGTAFHNKKDLAEHLTRLEEAKKRDHRKLGQELNLFTIDPMVGSGLILWKPRGAMVRMLLEEHLRTKLFEAGYEPVYTPHIGRLELYRTSGHFPYYRDAQFPPLYETDTARILNELWIAGAEKADDGPISAREQQLLDELKVADTSMWGRLVQPASSTADGKMSSGKRFENGPGMTAANQALIREYLQESDGFLLKPMNCPMHMRIYASEPRSYRDLPVRLAEFGTVYRYEQSGEVSGLTRVRGFTQDDAHLFVTPEQLQEELGSCLKLTRYVLEMLGLNDYRVRIGLHDPNDKKFIKNPQAWAESEAAVRAAAAASGMSGTEEIGEAAFYGPKIDFVVKDCIGREWQLGTVQCDYINPERFNLEYIGRDNRPHRPIMIHRAPFGSMERFVGILIEHFEGAFPTWLAPTQVMIATISEKSVDYARKVTAMLREAGFRVELDDSAEKIGPKKHRARKWKIPFTVVIGEAEANAKTVNLNDREGRTVDNMTLETFVEMLLQHSKPGGEKLAAVKS
ncbi:MAG: threonine--tRNA ligase [Planctomycetes bacterium]|nr:threonine--tRNA ligase [Planctomycetota bacterium]